MCKYYSISPTHNYELKMSGLFRRLRATAKTTKVPSGNVTR